MIFDYNYNTKKLNPIQGMLQQKIYLDYNATTPCAPEVIEYMLPFFSEMYGNASSKNHPYGWEAKKAVDMAREQIARLLGSSPEEIIFTSGATESINLILKGLYYSYKSKKNHFITCETEHSAVLDTLEFLEKQGAEVDYLPVNKDGIFDPESLKEKIRKDTLAVCLMWANNETGVIHDIGKCADICTEAGVYFAVDATQAAGKIPIQPHISQIDFLALSAHKMYGPKGIGALYMNKSKRIKITPLIHGGGHEKNIRSGTLNVPGIAGFGKAAELAVLNLENDHRNFISLQSYLESRLTESEECFINGKNAQRLPNTTNICLRFAENELLLSTFHQKLAVATGSACASADATPSHVLTAMGLSEARAKCSLRISMGRYTTLEEIDTAIGLIHDGVKKVRSESPKWQMFKSGFLLEEY